MMNTYAYKNITWVDVQSPDRDEIKSLSETYNLDPRIAHEIFTPSPIAEARLFDDVIFTVLHFPAYKQSRASKDEHTQEIDFIIGDTFLISIRYDTLDSLHRFTRKLEVDAITHAYSSQNEDINGMAMFYSIVIELQKATMEEIRHIKDRIFTLQKLLLKNDEEKLIFEISKLSHTLLDFQNALLMHKDTYERLTDVVEPLFGVHANKLIMDIRKNHHKLSSEVKHYRHVTSELRDAHLALLNARQNEIVKNLTIIAFFTFPITVVASLFGMNFLDVPFQNHPYGFWIVVGMMAFLILSAYLYFAYKRWI